jgi:hypothetical protein
LCTNNHVTVRELKISLRVVEYFSYILFWGENQKRTI